MLTNFKLTIEYDGSRYSGWQKQKNDRTLQGEIEKALMTMTDKKIVLHGSGRTDAGVHALGQVANFPCDTKILPEEFQRGLNSLLPDDIVIQSCERVHKKFHARFNAKHKTYSYRILNRPTPAAVGRQYAWFIRKKLDFDAMELAIPHIIGTHDFKAFEGSGSPRSHTIRSVMKAYLTVMDQEQVVFEIQADGFLRYMVRNIVGTLVDVGHGKITPDEFNKILLSRDRELAGATAPPHGLFLMAVKY
ncbi:MAG: tRNA pseudouridine(38-40) synthase TruA [Deltaproteobacteria bacterium]|nr:tRNA pseudouridine(38-40) synthase TruA [Deltaproteobacteria bacterium]